MNSTRSASTRIAVLGSTQDGFVTSPEVRIYWNGRHVGNVLHYGQFILDIERDGEIRFKYMFRSTRVRLTARGGRTQIRLSWDRTWGKLLAQVEESSGDSMPDSMSSEQTRSAVDKRPLERINPIARGLPTEVVAIAAGGTFCLALKVDGTVEAWGGNPYGQLEVPVGLANVTNIAAGRNHCLALTRGGDVVAWGSNLNGQTDVPADLSDVRTIFAGGEESVALTKDGRLVTWGAFGSAINGTLSLPDPVVAVGAGDRHLAILDAAGDVSGISAGIPSDDDNIAPPSDLSGIKAIAVGGAHCLALRTNGTVAGWGDNAYGQASVPECLADVAIIAAGNSASMAVRTDGSVVAWGYANEEVGDLPVPERLPDIAAIVLSDQSLALRHDGTLIAWGRASLDVS